ncbi:hypothetical protein MHUMG1_09831 [Metarhizium humberi]|uniref:Peptidase S1 domain-containing protein n=1 Tax=Metarhizium humberi TaxID=2596975 RepID=A0A9P8M2F3_9HYPO|nr:hypothetical protein MHUMG1_09831 [Metarhizium humberi]
MIPITAITLAAFYTILAAAATINKRIAGGEDAKNGEFPFIVSIQERGKHVCGGSLLSNITVLTAGHCYGRDPLSVKAGTTCLGANLKEGGVDVEIESGVRHPDTDIAILKLKAPIETTVFATLPPNDFDPVVNSSATIAGWGAQSSEKDGNGPPVDKLSKIGISINARDKCVKGWPILAGTNKFVCAGGDGKTICEYDSGSPLIDKKTGWLIGIAVSISPDKNREYCNLAPGLFERVSSWIPFINKYHNSSSPGYQTNRLNEQPVQPQETAVLEPISRRIPGTSRLTDASGL